MSEVWRCTFCGHHWAYIDDEDEPGIPEELEEGTIVLNAVPFLANRCSRCHPWLPERPRS